MDIGIAHASLEGEAGRNGEGGTTGHAAEHHVLAWKIRACCIAEEKRRSLTAKGGAIAVESAGGSGTETGQGSIETSRPQILELEVSPGGSADLLAATLFLDAVERGLTQFKPTKVGRSTYGTN